MAIAFKHRYKSDSLIGTGTIKFRPYTLASPLPQLATPQNVTANGTTVSWDEVENATSYAVLADGASIGEYVPAPGGFNVTIRSFSQGFIGFSDGDGALYSLDNGSTWNKITSSIILQNVTQVKFRLNIDWDPDKTSTIMSSLLSLSLSCGGYNTSTSDNFTLAQDINDIDIVIANQD